MTRAPMGDTAYWNLRIQRDSEWLARTAALLAEPSKNPAYDPQFSFDRSKDVFRLVCRSYSRGDAVASLGRHFPMLLDAWELSNRLSSEVCAEHGLETCRDWTFALSNLNHYNWCLWLIGIALALDIPNEQWHRLVALIDAEGQDVLLDRVIAARQPQRKIGAELLHPKPYARLLAAIDASPEDQAVQLRDFVVHWYAELARPAKDELWWYIYGDPVKHPLEMGSYFGRWCIEAVAAVKAFNLDDSLCLGHEHYPGDLLRPDGPTTHRKPEEPGLLRGLGSRLLNSLRR